MYSIKQHFSHMIHSLALEKILSALKSSNSALVMAHVSPDPDAIGSAGALTNAMRENGIEAELYLFDPVPSNLKPLLGTLPVLNEVPSHTYDLLVVLDTATRNRAGKAIDQIQSLAKLSINIDHHISNDSWADLNLIVGEAAASAEIVHDLLLALGWTISPTVATLLYAGLMDDTGSFRYSNTSVHALRTAASLVELGADPASIANWLYFSTPERVIRLRAEASRTLELHFGGRFSTLFVTEEMLRNNGCTSEDTESLVEIARSVNGVEACAFMKEAETNWKLSLRSKSDVIDVNKIAQVFDGGGHKAASGCKIYGTLDEVKAKVIGEFAKVFSV